jgi:hypothetical protein
MGEPLGQLVAEFVAIDRVDDFAASADGFEDGFSALADAGADFADNERWCEVVALVADKLVGESLLPLMFGGPVEEACDALLGDSASLFQRSLGGGGRSAPLAPAGRTSSSHS